MRVQFVSLLVAIAVISTSDGVSVITNSKLTTSRFGVAENTKRFLRAETFIDEDEERAINFNAIPGVGAIKNVFSKKVTLKNLLTYAEKKKSPNYIFKKLKLDEVDATMLFKNSDFNVWVAYVRLVNPKQGRAEESMIVSLTARYGDEVVARMLQAASKDTKMAEIAKQLQMKQLEGWKLKGLSKNGVFKLLQLNQGVDDLLGNPNLSIWLKYVNYIGKNGLDDEAIMIKTFMAHYSSNSLSQMIITAKNVPATKLVASELQSELLKVWQVKKKTPEEVFKLLQLNVAADGILTNPMLKTWLKYMDDFNPNNPDKETTMITTFMTHYNDESLMKMILSAKKVPATKAVASKLQTELLQAWQKSNKSPEDVFTLLKFDLDGLLVNPMLKTWTKYLDDFNFKNPISKESMINIVIKTYGDEALSKMLNAAKTDPKTTKFATELQLAQLKNWVSRKKDQREVYKLLGVKGTSGDNANRALWKQYVRDYNQKWIRRS